MALSVTALGSGVNTTDATSFATDPVDIGTNKRDILWVFNTRTGGSAPEPTISGYGLTWTKIDTSVSADGVQRVTAFRASGTPSNPSEQLTANESGIETSSAGWANDANVTVAQTAAQARSGTKSLSMTSSASGNMSTILARNGTGGIAVSPGQAVFAYVYMRAAVSTRNCRVDIRFYDSGGSTLSTVQGSSTADTTSGWTQIMSANCIAPASSATYSIIVNVLSTSAGSEVHYLDDGSSKIGGAIMDFGASTQSNCNWVLNEWDGTNVPRAIQSKAATATSATSITVTFDSALLATDTTGAVLFGMIKNQTGAVTPGTGFTETADLGTSGPAGRLQAMYDIARATNDADTSWTTSSTVVALAIEISDTAAAGDQTVTLSHVGPTATVFAPQVNQAVSLAHVGPTASVFAPQVNQSVTLAHVGPTASVFAPTISQAGGPQTVTLAHVGPTATLFTPQVNQSVALAHVGPTSQVFAPQVNQAVALPALGPLAQVFAPRVDLGVSLPFIASTAQVFAPQLNLVLTLPHLGPTASLFAPTVTGGASAPDLVPPLRAVVADSRTRAVVSNDGTTFVEVSGG